MEIVERASEMVRHPENEWAAVAGEDAGARDLTLNYVAPLAAIPALASFLGAALVGSAGVRLGFGAALLQAVAGFAIDVAIVHVLAYVMAALAPRHGVRPDRAAIFRVAAYSLTPVWLAGIVGLIPQLSLLILGGYAYAGYLLALGTDRLLAAGRRSQAAPDPRRFLRFAAICLGAVFAVVVLLRHLLAAMGGMPRLL